jgi:hypothetical protein
VDTGCRARPRTRRHSRLLPIGHGKAVTFRFSYVEHARRRRIVFEEKLDASGTAHLVVTHLDGEFTRQEMDEVKAEALAEWLHPRDPPVDWLE